MFTSLAVADICISSIWEMTGSSARRYIIQLFWSPWTIYWPWSPCQLQSPSPKKDGGADSDGAAQRSRDQKLVPAPAPENFWTKRKPVTSSVTSPGDEDRLEEDGNRDETRHDDKPKSPPVNIRLLSTNELTDSKLYWIVLHLYEIVQSSLRLQDFRFFDFRSCDSKIRLKM